VPVDRHGRSVDGEEIVLQRVDLPLQRAQPRRRSGRRRGEGAAEGRELLLRLRRRQVEEAEVRHGVAPVLETRLVEGAHLGKGHLAHGPHGRGAHAVQSTGRGTAQVGLQRLPEARPLRLEAGVVLALPGRPSFQGLRSGQIHAHGGETLQRQPATAVVQRLVGALEHRRAGVLHLDPELVRGRVVLQKDGPARDLGCERVGGRVGGCGAGPGMRQRQGDQEGAYS